MTTPSPHSYEKWPGSAATLKPHARRLHYVAPHPAQADLLEEQNPIIGDGRTDAVGQLEVLRVVLVERRLARNGLAERAVTCLLRKSREALAPLPPRQYNALG
jgi:hypothetical protein